MISENILVHIFVHRFRTA